MNNNILNMHYTFWKHCINFHPIAPPGEASRSGRTPVSEAGVGDTPQPAKLCKVGGTATVYLATRTPGEEIHRGFCFLGALFIIQNTDINFLFMHF
jgi:hypothetical protein